MGRIHWIGTGLSSIPGLRRLIKNKFDVYVWNRTVKKANDLVGDLTSNIFQFNIENIKKNIEKGDIVVSMLPGDWHVPKATLTRPRQHACHYCFQLTPCSA